MTARAEADGVSLGCIGASVSGVKSRAFGFRTGGDATMTLGMNWSSVGKPALKGGTVVPCELDRSEHCARFKAGLLTMTIGAQRYDLSVCADCAWLLAQQLKNDIKHSMENS